MRMPMSCGFSRIRGRRIKVEQHFKESIRILMKEASAFTLSNSNHSLPVSSDFQLRLSKLGLRHALKFCGGSKVAFGATDLPLKPQEPFCPWHSRPSCCQRYLPSLYLKTANRFG